MDIARQSPALERNLAWLWQSICVHALSEGDQEAASQYADHFFNAILELGSENPRYVFSLLDGFMTSVRNAGRKGLLKRAATIYLQLSDSGKQPSSEISMTFIDVTRPDFSRFKDSIPPSELSEFALQQFSFVMNDRRPVTSTILKRWCRALSEIGEIPPDWGRLSFQEQLPFIISLSREGRHDEALHLYRPIAEWAAKPLYADPDVPNNPGKVTRARYAIPQLGPHFDDVELAMQCVSQLETSDPASDYRKHGGRNLDTLLNTRIPHSLAVAKGLDAATDWTESLSDQDKQLQACVVLMEMATQNIASACDYERTSLATKLSQIDHIIS